MWHKPSRVLFIFLSVCLTPQDPKQRFTSAIQCLRVPSICDGHMCPGATFLSLSSLTYTMLLQPSLTSSPWNMSRKQLGPRGNSGDGHDWGLDECAEKESLPLFSPLKSCHKYYFKLNLTYDPQIYQGLARSRGQRWVLAAPSPPGPSCLQYHSSLCRQDFFFLSSENIEKKVRCGIDHRLWEFEQNYDIKVSHGDHTI